jgi:hypothetical protein
MARFVARTYPSSGPENPDYGRRDSEECREKYREYIGLDGRMNGECKIIWFTRETAVEYSWKK